MQQDTAKEPATLTPEEIAEQASKPDVDQIYRQLRGDETKDNPDEHGAGSTPDLEDTSHGREERKHQVEKEAEKQ